MSNRGNSEKFDGSSTRATRAQLAEADYHEDRPMNKPRYEQQEPSDARIMAQLDFMNEQLAKTHALSQELEERLEPILIPDFGEGNQDKIAHISDRPASSVVSNALDDMNSRVSLLQTRIIQLASRVQL